LAGEILDEGELGFFDLAGEELVLEEAVLETVAFLRRERVAKIREQEGAGGRVLIGSVQGAFPSERPI
jgi:hypothetical protein